MARREKDGGRRRAENQDSLPCEACVLQHPYAQPVKLHRALRQQMTRWRAAVLQEAAAHSRTAAAREACARTMHSMDVAAARAGELTTDRAGRRRGSALLLPTHCEPRAESTIRSIPPCEGREHPSARRVAPVLKLPDERATCAALRKQHVRYEQQCQGTCARAVCAVHMRVRVLRML